MLCSVEGCVRPKRTRGFCNAHYERYRLHGSVGSLPIRELDEPLAFAKGAVSYQGNDCLLWPFGKTRGYGRLSVGYVHHYVCEQINGPPSDGQEAAHSCGERACINPKHLRWDTRLGNMADAIRHGRTRKGRSPYGLTLHDVLAIRSATVHPRSQTVAETATQFGVPRSTVENIIAGRSWSWVCG